MLCADRAVLLFVCQGIVCVAGCGPAPAPVTSQIPAAKALPTPPQADPLVAPLLVELHTADSRERRTVLVKLGALGPRSAAAVPAIQAALEDNDLAVRSEARTALRFVDPKAAAQLLGKPYDSVKAARDDIATLSVGPRDWPQWGGSRLRHATPEARNLPFDWHIGEDNSARLRAGAPAEHGSQPLNSRNVLWASDLGSQTYGNVVVANGRVFIGTNNGAGYLPRFPPTVDLGCLLCFDEKTGRFLWQYSSPKLPTGRVHDWPMQGICSTPVVDGDRLWFTSNRCEIVCLDAKGFHDDVNDGPDQSEPAGDKHEADVVWKFDMMKELGVSPHNMSNCSPVIVGDLLFVNTSNGVDEAHSTTPAPQAPSFLAMNRHTAKVLWTDNRPGANILHAQWSSPSYAVLGGAPQVLFAGGDGWLYSFAPEGDGQGNSKLLWEFDCNPKESLYSFTKSSRNQIIAFPVIDDGLVYLAVGEDPEHGEGEGHLWCIDPTRRGDVSAELAVDAGGKTLPRRRRQAVIAEDGERAIPNPNSAAVWHYQSEDRNGDGKVGFDEEFHRSLGMPVIRNDILYVADFSGLVHCLNARSGAVYWTHDLLAACWGSALLADGKVYIGDEDGYLTVFEHRLGFEPKVLATIDMGNSIYSTPVVANDILYVTTRNRLFAIADLNAKRD